VEDAGRLGADVVNLDMSIPFSAARARNEGFNRLLNLEPKLGFVQFIDGDCELNAEWLQCAIAEFRTRPEVAIVFGRLSERFPEASIYNRLCDLEWDSPAGESRACGGISLMRADVFRQVGGFDPSVLAAEDDEICLRIRRAGWKIWRIAAPMALHDAAMTRFGQWWKRATRCGYAFAQGARMHGHLPERHFVRECRRIWLWGFLIPLLALGLAWPTWGISLGLLLLYPLQVVRIYRQQRWRPVARRHLWAYATACVVSKIPEWIGYCKFHFRRWRGRPTKLIEYK
jgi:cellulose synthase/poly-beta-1,6-N-acetylglucosamine synthase-like glycosyltransferase